jgi:hypothetical protein
MYPLPLRLRARASLHHRMVIGISKIGKRQSSSVSELWPNLGDGGVRKAAYRGG